jgi:hypothetical protein
MRSLFFYLFATLFITASLFNQWQQVECVAAETLQDDEPMQDELLLDPLNEGGGHLNGGHRSQDEMKKVNSRRAWRN